MKVRLQYGERGLETDFGDLPIDVLEPKFVEGLPDEAAAFREAARAPIGARPLRDVVRPGETLAVLIPDITRPCPSDRLLPWIFEELPSVAPDRVVIVNGTGSHRANSGDELARMVGPDTLRRFRVVNHDARDRSSQVCVGRDPSGGEVWFNRAYAEADRRIVVGFIEPHFIAGFSGGYKGVFPAVGDIDAILRYHGARVVGDPGSTWGRLDGNPTQAWVRAVGPLRPVDFLVNVTLNSKRRITGFFCGDPIRSHERGAAFARKTAMIPCVSSYPVVVTTNSGYPLDQNLYQTVKGLSAAAEIVTQDGLIVCAAECRDGFPDHGNFRKLIYDYPSPQALLDAVNAPSFSIYDQWEAQLLARIQVRARVALKSRLPDADVRRAHIEPIGDVSARVKQECARLGPSARVAVLPEGPQTIPYLAGM